MADLLLELLSEEIPARMQADALAHLKSALQKGLGSSEVQGFVTPRRLAVIVRDLPAMQPDVTAELKGPKIDAPEAALNGFLKKNNLTLEQLEKRDGVYFSTSHVKGKETAEIIKPLIEEIMTKFPWPKSMRWGSGQVVWVRPLQSILCIFDGKIVPVEFAGVKADNKTYGHRFLAPLPININKVAEYESTLEKSFVIADREKRKAEIVSQADKVASELGLTVKSDIGLLEEVVGLVEHPKVLVGRIDDKFMDLPPEVLTMVMRSHQKYFALLDKEGKLSPYFLITSNMETEDGGKAIIAGNERVLRARFADARFFWDSDRNKSLSDWAEGLKTVTYHAKLGSVADKVERVKKLSLALAEYVPGADKKLVERAADLSKADLVTGMVGEFAELQGVMGRYYAIQQKEVPEISDAIRDHYKPQGANDIVPTAPVSICVALADKLDTLVSMFAIGEKPTGSKDPFALRRAALGVIRIVLDNNIRLPLAKIINSELIAFFHDRLKVQLKDSGLRHDVIDAALMGDDDLVRIVNRAKALQEFLASEDGKNLLAAYKRAANILSIEEKKDKKNYNEPIDSFCLSQFEEIELSKALTVANSTIKADIKNEVFIEIMKDIAKLRTPIDMFFEKILVNDQNAEVRANRLRLLASIRDSMNLVADFSKIEG